jgi:hypothetical protein
VAYWAVSCRDGNVTPAVLAVVAPESVHDHRELARDGHFGASHTDPLSESQTPGLQRRGTQYRWSSTVAASNK